MSIPKMNSLFLVFVGLTAFIGGSFAAFNPTLAVTSCTQSKLIVNLTNAEAGGIIYIQGQGSACKLTTAATATVHEFDFTSCGISWASSFKMIIQKKALYQTGDDKQIPVMCIADLSDLTVGNNINALDKDDDAGQNLTTKPTASMKIYNSGLDVSGGSVQLTSVLTMAIELDAEFRSDFDIVATQCTASTIAIISSSCADDTELFPNFGKASQGYLSSTFGAFRTTDLNGGSVGMTFSCTLTVCLGACSAVTCGNGESGYGRKKRGISKRQAGPDNTVFETVSVGASLKIAAEEIILETPEEAGELCMDKSAFVVLLVVIMAGLIASAAVSIFLARKLKEKNSVLKKLDSGMSGVAMG